MAANTRGRGRGRGSHLRPRRDDNTATAVCGHPSKYCSRKLDTGSTAADVQEAPAAMRPQTEGGINPAAAVQAFKGLRGDLMRAIVEPLALANDLYSKDIVPMETIEDMLATGTSKTVKNMALLNAIEARLQTNPSDFWILVAVLEADPVLKTFVPRLREKYSASHESPTPVPCSPENRSPMARYANYLKAYYRTAPVAPDIPECCKWPPTPSTKFINLAVVKKERVSSRAEADRFTRATLHGNIDEILKVKKAIRMQNVLKSEDEAELKCVLVEGAPGVGKSTFAWELCRRWDEIEAMRKYSAVVLLRLREKRVQEAKTVADLFYHDNPSVQQAVAEEITSNGGANTLLVLDGFDEVPVSVQKSSLLVEIIRGVCLPKATVLVTSRPSARADLLSVCRSQVHKHIEILGFTHELIEQYAGSIFDSDPALLADFLKYTSANPAIKSMMYIPLNSAIVVEIYRENRMVGRPIPQTMTQLYNELTLTLLGRYLSEEAEYPVLPDKLEDLPQNLYHQLLILAKLAFEGIVKKEVIFDRLPDGCSPLGLMNASAELYVRRRRVNFNFLHATLQEFLSAFYISQLPASKQKMFRYPDGKHFLNVVGFPHLKMVWRFVAGLTGLKGIGWDVVHPGLRGRGGHCESEQCVLSRFDEPQAKVRSCKSEQCVLSRFYEVQAKVRSVLVRGRRGRSVPPVTSLLTHFYEAREKEISFMVSLCRRVNESGTLVTPFIAHCLYEAQEKVDCESVLGRPSKFELHDATTSFDCFVVGYTIAISKCAWEVNVYYQGLGAEMVEMLVCGLKSKEEVQGSIEELELNGNPIKQEGVAHLKEMPHKVLQQISHLMLRTCELDRASLDLLSDIIPIMTNLKRLDIIENPAGDGGTVKLLQTLGNLHSLLISLTNMGYNDIMALSRLITPTGCLKELVIGDKDMPPECVELMMKTVLSPSSLEDLTVGFVDLTSCCYKCLSQLAVNHNLTKVELCACTLEVDFTLSLVEILCETMQKNDTLSYLKLPKDWQENFPQIALDRRVQWSVM